MTAHEGHDTVRQFWMAAGLSLFAAVLGQRGELARELVRLGWDRDELRQASSIHRQVRRCESFVICTLSGLWTGRENCLKTRGLEPLADPK